jgi:hypothetical protein
MPYLFPEHGHIIGPKVTKWRLDQFSSGTACTHVAVSS